MNGSLLWKAGCLNAGLSVVLAAVGGHRKWDEERTRVFSKANFHHAVSSLGVVLASLRNANYAGACFLIGSGLFSAVGYYRCFKDDKSFNRLMPVGGTLFIFGWVLLAFS